MSAPTAPSSQRIDRTESTLHARVQPQQTTLFLLHQVVLPSLWPLAGACLAATGLLLHTPIPLLALALALALLGLRAAGAPSLTAVLPGLGAASFAWSGLLLWSLLGLGAAIWLAGAAAALRTAALRSDPLAARQARLERHLERTGILLDACIALSAAHDANRFAAELCRHARALAPEAKRIAVWLGTPSQLRQIASDPPTLHSSEPDAALRYTSETARVLWQRGEGQQGASSSVPRLLLPLRGDRRSGRADDPGEGRAGDLRAGNAGRGVLELTLPVLAGDGRLTRDLLEALARLAGLGLAAVELEAESRALALRDDLTGLFGRAEFLRRFDEELAERHRHGDALALVLCDLDHLKALNDAHGHAAGDAALIAVAAALSAALPPRGLACRWGGEEFALLLPNHDRAAALAIAERVRQAIAAAVIDPARMHLRVTASLGVAVIAASADAKTPAASAAEPGLQLAGAARDALATQTIARADHALYRAKAAGRNAVELAEDQPGTTA